MTTKKKVPAFPLPVITATLQTHVDGWVPPVNKDPADPSYFDGYYVNVDVEVEVLTVNFQTGTMRVRSAYYGVRDILAHQFFEQYNVEKK